MTLLELDAVTRSVELPDGEKLEILKGVDLAVEVGDHVSIVGRSGSGKTTLLNLLGLLDTPTSGRILFDGEPLESLTGGRRDRKRGRDIGFIFQQFNLLDGRTALENVMTPLLYASGTQFWRRSSTRRRDARSSGAGAPDGVDARSSSPAASSSGSRSPARSCADRGSSSRTSRPERSTSRPAPR